MKGEETRARCRARGGRGESRPTAERVDRRQREPTDSRESRPKQREPTEAERAERADRRWRQGVEIMGRSGDGVGRRSRRRAPPKLAVVPRDEGSGWVALDCGGRARTTSSDTWGLPPPGTPTPTAPLENPGIGVRGGERRLLGRRRRERADRRRERADRRWRQGVEIMGGSGDGVGRRSRRRAPPKLAVVPRDEGSGWVALDCGGRARTTSSDTCGLPPPGTSTPTAPLENPGIGVRGGASRRRPTRAGTSGGKRAERERKESGKRAERERKESGRKRRRALRAPASR